MMCVVSIVKNARVEVDGEISGEIDKGFLCLVGIHSEDSEKDAEYVSDRVCGMRVFKDENGKMNLSPKDAGASILAISQFTLFGDISKRRPGFTDSARPDKALPLFEKFCALCRQKGFDTQTGVFGANMQIHAHHDGPVTLIIDSNLR